MPCDFVADLLNRCAEAFGIDAPERIQALEAELRRDWGGERVYIAKTLDADRCEMTARNAAILRDSQAGERVVLLARKYGISKQRVSQIIQEQRQAASLTR